jgi:group I intron endonuclease
MHKNKINGKVYIGKTCRKPEYRWAHGKGYLSQPVFGNAIKKYGWDGFEHIIIADGLSQEDAKKMEIDLISQYKSTNRNHGYNMTEGGEGWLGCKHSEEWRRKLIEYNKTRVLGPEFIQRQRESHIGKGLGKDNPFYGKKHTDETKRKISEANKGRLSGENNPFYGKKHSEESRRKISEARKGTKMPPRSTETRKKISEAQLVAQNRPEVKAAKSERFSGAGNPNYGKTPTTAKPVSQYTKDGNWVADYPSAMHAKKATGISNCSIAACCKGQLKSAGGFIWKYKTND